MHRESLRLSAARLILLVSAVMTCACDGSDRPAESSDKHLRRTTHWDYGDDGPSVWAELSPDYAMCANGTSQSPIDLALPEHGEPAIARIEFSSAPGVMTFNEHVEDIVDNGHTIQVSFDDSSVIELDGAAYELEQFHFHTPSEHTLDGVHFPMETHFVYRNAAGRFLVVGVFVTAGEHNSAFDHLVSNFPDRGGSRHVEKVVTSLEQMAPGGARGYRYSGSLTTPPCLEEVIWLISAQPLEMSVEQLDSFASRIGHNARPVQPVNGRLLSDIKFVEDPAP